jgi:NTE family protein
VVLDVDPQAWERTDDADLHHDRQLRSHLSLADGGLYDSLALERVWDRYDTVLVSDALQEFSIESRGFGRFLDRASRTISILATQSHGLRKRKLIEDFRAGTMAGAYWGIGMQLADFELEAQGLPAAMIPDNDITGSLKKLRTRFAPFNRQEQGQLINWGFAVTDAAIRRHLLPDAPAPEGWPMPEFGL